MIRAMQEVSAETGAAEKMERWPLFDVMRVAAAVGVVISHAFPLTGGATVALFSTPGKRYDLGGLSVGVFFVLSGWLITASWGRNSAGSFALRRFARIMPGLVVATLFAVFVIGPLATTRPLGDYFTSGQTWEHLANNALMRPLGERGLPGVFEANPEAAIVNGSLWTLPHEAISYVAVAVLGAVGLLRRRAVVGLLAIAVTLLASLGIEREFIGGTGLLMDDTAILGAWFLLGSALYLWRDRLPWNRVGAFTALVLLVVTSGSPLTLPLVAFLVLYVGTRQSDLRLPKVLGDPSYGIYVYAFPVQQAVVAAAPSLSPAQHVMVALPVIVLLGVASWRLVEAPIMRRVRSEFGVRRPVAERPASGRGDRAARVVVDPEALGAYLPSHAGS